MQLKLFCLIGVLGYLFCVTAESTAQDDGQLESNIVQEIVSNTVQVTFDKLYHLSPKTDEEPDLEGDVEIQKGDILHSKRRLGEADVVSDERTSKQRRERLSACVAVVQKAMNIGQKAYETAFIATVDKYQNGMRIDDIGRTVFFSSLASCYNKIDDDFAASVHDSLIGSSDLSVNIPKPDLEFVDMASVGPTDPVALSPQLLDIFKDLIQDFSAQHEERIKKARTNSQAENPKSNPAVEKAVTVSRIAGYGYFFGVLGLMGGCIWYAAVKLKDSNGTAAAAMSKRARKMKLNEMKKRN